MAMDCLYDLVDDAEYAAERFGLTHPDRVGESEYLVALDYLGTVAKSADEAEEGFGLKDAIEALDNLKSTIESVQQELRKKLAPEGK